MANPVNHHLEARRLAQKRLPRLVFDYIDGAAGQETAALGNTGDLGLIKLSPRVLADLQSPDLGTSFLGKPYSLPFGIAPMGMCNLAWPGADRVLASLAQKMALPLGVSTAASTPMAQMFKDSGGQAWFQLYVSGSADAGLALAQRATQAGYDTLVLTVDVPKVAPRPRDVRNGFQMPFRMGPRQFVDFALHPRWSLATLWAGAPTPANFDPQQGGFDRHASRAGANWAFLDQLRGQWRGQLIVKGVMHPDDAERIAKMGVDAIYVSNHGGRQLDAAPSAISALHQIRQRLGPQFPLVFDSGVRTGEDVVKALSCGANMVMLGRPVLYALAAGGEGGLQQWLASLREELWVTLSQLGLSRIQDVGPHNLACVPFVQR
jgi:isopentenyl diphosphate isomerase/L-lactate dehydrogenase-like FMN-dependent dehydrogenase